MAFVQSFALPRTGISHGTTSICSKPAAITPVVVSPLEIRAAKHAQFKAAKKADRCRPKKHRPSDINRKPPPFNPEPLRAEGIPVAYTVVAQSEAASDSETVVSQSEAASDSEAVVSQSEAASDSEAVVSQSEAVSDSETALSQSEAASDSE